jgi:hypothetical protein
MHCNKRGATLCLHNHFLLLLLLCFTLPQSFFDKFILVPCNEWSYHEDFHQTSISFSLHHRAVNGDYKTAGIINVLLPSTSSAQTHSAILARLSGPRDADTPSADMCLIPPLTGIKTVEDLPRVRGLAQSVLFLAADVCQTVHVAWQIA